MDTAAAEDCKDAGGGTLLTLDVLPVEMLLRILSYLGTRDVGACAMSGRALALACDDRALWTRLHEHERVHEETRWRAAAARVSGALRLCSQWNWEQTRMREDAVEGILDEIIVGIDAIVSAPWHANIDLAGLLGHPRFACAARVHVRVLLDPLIGTPRRAAKALAGPAPYASVGTVIYCTGVRYLHSTKVAVHRGFFDADGVPCGPGLAHTQLFHQGAVAPWRACAGVWHRGHATTEGGRVWYGDGCRYFGGLDRDYCHGSGCIYGPKGDVAVVGQWKHNVAHGVCSWRGSKRGTEPQSKFVGNAVFAGGRAIGPIAYFADGRLVARVPRPHPLPRLPELSIDPYGFLSVGRDYYWHTDWPRYAHAQYGPSGTTFVTDSFFAHRWPDGALVIGKTHGEYYYEQPEYRPLLLIDACGGIGDDDGAPFLVDLGRDSAFSRDPRTLAVSLHAGTSVDECHRQIASRDPVTADGPPGLAPDGDHRDDDRQDGVADAPFLGSAPGHGAGARGDGRHGRTDDHALSQQDFARAIALASPGRVGVDEADESTMTDGVRVASDLLLALLDAHTVPPTLASLCVPSLALSGGRIRDALYLAEKKPVRKTSRLDMTLCTWRRCAVVGAVFEECDFRRARFERCVFYACSFARCAFFGAVFAGTRFVSCSFAYDTQSVPTPASPARFVVGTDDAGPVLDALGATVS
ncbi:F-box domain containing protein [Pandoravirus japonicus]|uniref:F-box domain containing protein n=1 Tax=Pandoravirus japonicus TaxID=2823154 RepID=A0A811BQE9_9VIRU|nr:F-box domain containing protein [Pandoravirus japonicus]